MGRKTGGEMGLLPEGCIANVISFTTPLDACRLSLVSRIFKSAAESDVVWERFLTPEYPTIMSNSTSSSSPSFSSMKDLYFSLCHNPILIDDGKKSFSLDKYSGKKCYMISARDLMIVWGDTPMFWRWTSIPESRFPEVAELVDVCWFEIRGRISTRSLSPGTLYTAYFVYKQRPGAYGFEYQPVEVSVGLVGSESQIRAVYLDAERGRIQRHQAERVWRRQRHRFPRSTGLYRRSRNWYYPKVRADEWLEIELGDFFNEENEEGELEMSLLEVVGNSKCGIIVQGLEIRPKQGK